MKEKFKEWYNRPIFIFASLVFGGILGIFAYIGDWLG